MACYAAEPLKVRLSIRSQNVPSLPPKPLHKHQSIRRHLVTAHFSQLTNTSVTLRALIIVHSGVHCGLKYQHWPMKRKLFLEKAVSGVLCPYNSDKTNAQNSEIPTNINVYSYRRARRPDSCSAGVICRG